MDTTTLTTRQQAVLSFIRNHIEQRGVAPTVREIADAFGIGSTNGVMCHLNALEKKGYIERGQGTARHIRIVGEPSREEVVQVLREVVEALKSVEWGGTNQPYECCPWCERIPGMGHKEYCAVFLAVSKSERILGEKEN